MNEPFLTINHHPLSLTELADFSEHRIKQEKTPAWEKAVYQFIKEWMKSGQSIVQYSSGTTGKSKKLILSKQSMIRSAENTCRYFDLHPGQTALLCLPVNYIAGKMMVVRSIIGRLDLLLVEPKSKPELESGTEIDFCAMVPMQVMDSFQPGGVTSRIHTLIIGGAEISPELINRVKELPMRVFATYGMAETCSHIAVRQINGPADDLFYHAMPGVDLDKDERGCLIIKADYLSAPVVTNDRVQLEGRKKFKWMGRFDNLINSGGIKIIPEEVEMAMAEKTGLTCALFGLPDKKLGQRLIFVAEKKSPPVPDSLIISELQKLLPRQMILKIVWIEKFTRNRALKIDRRKLAALLAHID